MLAVAGQYCRNSEHSIEHVVNTPVQDKLLRVTELVGDIKARRLLQAKQLYSHSLLYAAR
jgi:hypothetical protein